MRRLTFNGTFVDSSRWLLASSDHPSFRDVNLDDSCTNGNIDNHSHTQPDTYWNAGPYSYTHPRPNEHPVYARTGLPR